MKLAPGFSSMLVALSMVGCVANHADPQEQGGPGGGKADGAWSRMMTDVTSKWTYRYHVVSAYPSLYRNIPVGDHDASISVIYHFTAPNPSGESGQRRVEVFTTHGDCGSSLFVVTDAEQYRYSESGEPLVWPAGIVQYHYDQPRVYYVERFSTWDSASCGTRPYAAQYLAPGTHFFHEDFGAIQTFIEQKFFNDKAFIQKAFIPLCTGDYWLGHPGERPCIDPASLGNLG
jgi:hypothetical protein